MKTFKSYLTDLEEIVSAKSLKSTVRFGGETFKLDREGNYDLQGKYKGALYISVGDGVVQLSMNIGDDNLEKWISDMQQKIGEKKWPEDDYEGKYQEKYFDKPIIHGKIWKAATTHFKKLGYRVSLGD